MRRRSATSPTGAIASRRWWRSIRRTGCFWTSPAARICSAARLRCCRRFVRALARQGFAVSAAIAGTSVCARTLTRQASGTIVADGGEAAAISRLPVSALGAGEAITTGLRRAGLKTIGDVASREPHEITARFGARFSTLLAHALGHGDAPINPRKPLPDYIVEKRFAEPIATDTMIAMTLSRLADTLIASMEKQGKGARRLEAAFFRTDGVVRAIMVETGRPVTQSKVIDRLFRERLDALADPLDPGFGFDMVRLSASRTEIVVQEQRDLDAHVHDNDELAALIDRIAARIGGKRVVVHLPEDTHIPECAVLAAPAQHHLAVAMQAEWPARAESEPPLRPLRLFDRPEPIKVPFATVPDGPPHQFTWRRALHAVVRVEGPERIAMEWWRQDGKQLTRDYFRIEDAEGLRFWIFRDGLYEGEVFDDEGKPIPPTGMCTVSSHEHARLCRDRHHHQLLLPARRLGSARLCASGEHPRHSRDRHCRPQHARRRGARLQGARQ